MKSSGPLSADQARNPSTPGNVVFSCRTRLCMSIWPAGICFGICLPTYRVAALKRRASVKPSCPLFTPTVAPARFSPIFDNRIYWIAQHNTP